LNLGNRDDAAKWYETAFEIDNSYAPAINNLANLKRQSGNNQEAIDLFKRAIQADPNLIQAYLGVAASFLTLGDLDQAESLATQTLEIKEDAPGINEILGIISQNKGNPEQAIEYYQKELKNNPEASNSLLNSGLLLLQKGQTDEAVEPLARAAAINPSEQCSLLLAQAYQNTGQLKEAIVEYKRLDLSQSNNRIIPFNLGLCLLNTGNNIEAIEAFKIAIQLDATFIGAWGNLGNALKSEGRYQEALEATQKVLELDPDNPTALTNLGIIYKDLGNLDQALTSTLKSLELKPDNPGAVSNIKGFIDQLNISPSNAHNITRAYELLLNQKDISHKKLSKIFLQAFLPTIQKASAPDPIIAESNEALKALATDWRFRRSLTLMIPPSSEVERFFTRLRKELLTLAIQEGTIPPQLKPLTENLAAQCFLNEYVYSSSQEEADSITKLIDAATDNQEAINQYLAIIGCYKAIHTTCVNPELINNYPTPDDSSKELIATQFKEPHDEQEIKTSFQETHNITDSTSQRVQEMYEENPYPRFKYSDYTASELAKPIFSSLKMETTRKDLTFPEALSSPNANPKVLIAGFGTGNQVINASRYKTLKSQQLISAAAAWHTRPGRQKNVA